MRLISNLYKIVARVIKVGIVPYGAFTLRECMLADSVVNEAVSNLFNSTF